MEIKNNLKIDQSFLLVDSTTEISKINKLKNSFKKIISFDLESDRLLTDNSINHEISENFIPDEELKSIFANGTMKIMGINFLAMKE